MLKGTGLIVGFLVKPWETPIDFFLLPKSGEKMLPIFFPNGFSSQQKLRVAKKFFFFVYF